MARFGTWARWLGFGWSAMTAVLLAGACSSSGGGDGGYCESLARRERECGFIGEGRTSCTNYEDAAEVCETRCVLGARCAEIGALACSMSFGYENALNKCFAQCVGLEPVDCGNGRTLSGFSRCNELADCDPTSSEPSASVDEQGCESTGYPCRNVDQRIDPAKFCDGEEDCNDGSDELPDCKTVLTCEDQFGGQAMLNPYGICNGIEECADGSDEPSDCATHMCD